MENIFEKLENIQLVSTPQAIIGIDLARLQNFDLILMDINLPDIDGIEAFNILKNDAQVKSMPVIAVSANATEGEIKKALKVGFSSFITKPFNVNELLSTIEEQLKAS